MLKSIFFNADNWETHSMSWNVGLSYTCYFKHINLVFYFFFFYTLAYHKTLSNILHYV